jgi:pimeloyl-ACP methyl ester carboxylesterase
VKDPKNPSNPSLPVWVVVHGRADKEDSNNIQDVTEALSKGYQVVTLDWRDAANDNEWYALLKGATWIKTVGAWATRQLVAAGVPGENVFVAGHSWGSFVGYEIGKMYRDGDGKELKGNGKGVGGIVALDSAVNPSPTNPYDEDKMDFGSVSKLSWALRSSAFGSENRAKTATVNFNLMTPTEYGACGLLNINPLDPASLAVRLGKYVTDEAQAYYGEHGYATTLFANILRGKGDASLNTLKIEDLMTGIAPLLKRSADNPEGVILLDFEEARGPEGAYQRAVPLSLVDISY